MALSENNKHLINRFNEEFPCINSSCDGAGNIPHQVNDDEWEAEQCQFCFEYRFKAVKFIQKELATQMEDVYWVMEDYIKRVGGCDDVKIVLDTLKLITKDKSHEKETN